MSMTPQELVQRLIDAQNAQDAEIERRQKAWASEDTDPTRHDLRTAVTSLSCHLKPGNSAVVGDYVVTCDEHGRICLTKLVEL